MMKALTPVEAAAKKTELTNSLRTAKGDADIEKVKSGRRAAVLAREAETLKKRVFYQL